MTEMHLSKDRLINVYKLFNTSLCSMGTFRNEYSNVQWTVFYTVSDEEIVGEKHEETP